MPDEYISREALLEHLDRCKQSEDATTLTAAVITALQCFIQSQPTADVAPVVHGRWKKVKKTGSTWECSACGVKVGAFLAGCSQYCYCCGARMDMDGAAE